MAITAPIRNRIIKLKKKYDRLREGKESLLKMIDEAEISESVYNSNAIENSTLSLKETEKILLEMEVSRNVSLREVFEAKNLARVMQYIEKKAGKDRLDEVLILLLHKMLITNINDDIAGRFRSEGEYVRVGIYIAPAPEHVIKLIEKALQEHASDLESFLVDKITKFHLDFERIHPFIDGNGRIGRVLMNYQFLQNDFPTIIVRNKDKKHYYQAFKDFDDTRKTQRMGKLVALAITESLHKRIAYMEGEEIITLSDYARKYKLSGPAIHNAARRQTIPAFREKNVWKISSKFEK
jgi:Fic family protein